MNEFVCSKGGCYIACVTIAADHPLITCVTFDEGWNGVQGSRGLWVLNEGVTIANTSCVYKNCGVFDGSARLEVPYFANNWAGFNGFSFSLFFKRNPGSSNQQGILSNDCFNMDPFSLGNSLYVSSDAGEVNSGLKSPDAETLDIGVGLICYIY